MPLHPCWWVERVKQRLSGRNTQSKEEKEVLCACGACAQAHTAASKQPLEAYERFAEARMEEVTPLLQTCPCLHLRGCVLSHAVSVLRVVLLNLHPQHISRCPAAEPAMALVRMRMVYCSTVGLLLGRRVHGSSATMASSLKCMWGLHAHAPMVPACMRCSDQVWVLKPNKQAIGKAFKREAKPLQEAIEAMGQEDAACLQAR